MHVPGWGSYRRSWRVVQGYETHPTGKFLSEPTVWPWTYFILHNYCDIEKIKQSCWTTNTGWKSRVLKLRLYLLFHGVLIYNVGRDCTRPRDKIHMRSYLWVSERKKSYSFYISTVKVILWAINCCASLKCSSLRAWIVSCIESWTEKCKQRVCPLLVQAMDHYYCVHIAQLYRVIALSTGSEIITMIEDLSNYYSRYSA